MLVLGISQVRYPFCVFSTPEPDTRRGRRTTMNKLFFVISIIIAMLVTACADPYEDSRQGGTNEVVYDTDTRRDTTSPTRCDDYEDDPCMESYVQNGQCVYRPVDCWNGRPLVDLRGSTGKNQSGTNGGVAPDGTDDHWDDDGDGFCETSPCEGSANAGLDIDELRGGDCDDNPDDDDVYGESEQNHPGAYEHPDNFDNDCNGRVDNR